MRVEVAGRADDAEIRRLLRDNPLEGTIRLSLECEPDADHAAGVQGDTHQVLVVRDAAGGPVVGMGARTLLDAWIDGAPARLGYLSQLRADRGHRGRGRAVVHAYGRLRELHADGAVPFYVTTIVADDRAARRLLEAGVRGMPRYRPLEPLVTLVLPARRRAAPRAAGLVLERGRDDTLEDVARCLERHGRRHQFAPVWSAATLRGPRRARGLAPADFTLARRDGRVVGCAAVWDQRAFKQSVVRGYGGALGLARPLVNAAAALARAPALPPPGAALRAAFLSHVAVGDDDPAVFEALAADALTRAAARGLDHLVTGFALRHPLAAVATRAFRPRRYTSMLYVVHWEDGAAAADRLGALLPHLEVAIL